jgi:hypothetical protein
MVDKIFCFHSSLLQKPHKFDVGWFPGINKNVNSFLLYSWMSFNRLESEPITSTSGEKAVKNHGIGPFAEFSRHPHYFTSHKKLSLALNSRCPRSGAGLFNRVLTEALEAWAAIPGGVTPGLLEKTSAGISACGRCVANLICLPDLPRTYGSGRLKVRWMKTAIWSRVTGLVGQ